MDFGVFFARVLGTMNRRYGSIKNYVEIEQREDYRRKLLEVAYEIMKEEVKP